jgi:hypothetical protein
MLQRLSVVARDLLRDVREVAFGTMVNCPRR